MLHRLAYGLVPRTAVALLADLTARGYEVRLSGEQVIVRSGAAPLDATLRERILAEKPALLALLRRFEEDQPEPDTAPH